MFILLFLSAEITNMPSIIIAEVNLLFQSQRGCQFPSKIIFLHNNKHLGTIKADKEKGEKMKENERLQFFFFFKLSKTKKKLVRSNSIFMENINYYITDITDY